MNHTLESEHFPGYGTWKVNLKFTNISAKKSKIFYGIKLGPGGYEKERGMYKYQRLSNFFSSAILFVGSMSHCYPKKSGTTMNSSS